METKSSAHYKNSVLATAILFSVAFIALITFLLGFLLHGSDYTHERILVYIALEIVWTIMLCVMVFYSVHMANLYRKEARDESMDILGTLNGNYNAVFLADFDNSTISELRVKPAVLETLELKGKIDLPYNRFIATYIEHVVVPENRGEFRKEMDEENLLEKLSDRDYYSYIFKGYEKEKTGYIQMKICKTGKGDKKFVIGFADVDDEIRSDEEKKRIMKKALNEAENANKAKNAFLTNMSHDIRTPLNAIMGFAAVAEWHLNDPETIKEYIEKITVASNQMLYLVNNVLDMSMIEGGTMKLANDSANLRSIVQDVEIVTRTLAGERQQELSVFYKQLTHESIITDRVALNRVLMNLIGNASQYTPDGGKISLTITELTSNSKEATYSFVFEDNGIGMEPQYIPHSYEMFSREYTTTESGIPGVGLGLTITKNIIEAMGGNIEISSEKMKGTKVTVLLSFAISEEKIEFKEIKDSDKKEDIVSEDCPRILIAEDNSLNREILENILVNNGYAVDRAFNGKEAVEMFEESRIGYYKMILMDIRMPVMDGHSATLTIRKMDREDAKSIPIIAVTANAFSQDVTDAKQAGMNDHIAKPVKVSKIKEILAEYIK